MKKVTRQVKLNWRKILDWRILSVTQPMLCYSWDDVIGYTVTVTRHHIKKTKFFEVKPNGFFLRNHMSAYNPAKKYSNKMQRRQR